MAMSQAGVFWPAVMLGKWTPGVSNMKEEGWAGRRGDQQEVRRFILSGNNRKAGVQRSGILDLPLQSPQGDLGTTRKGLSTLFGSRLFSPPTSHALPYY